MGDISLVVGSKGNGLVEELFPDEVDNVVQSRGDVRANYSAYGAAVGGVIAMSADVLIDRAGIETGSAANTVKAFARLLIGEDIGPSIVQEYNDHLFRSVGFPGLFRARDNSIIDG